MTWHPDELAPVRRLQVNVSSVWDTKGPLMRRKVISPSKGYTNVK